MSLPKTDCLEYFKTTLENVVKVDSTANGNTDDKNPGQPTQSKCLGQESTDARAIANVSFTGKGSRIPAALLAAQDTYDVTQARTRINLLYIMSREDFYKQSSAAVTTRLNRLERKGLLTGNMLKLSSDAEKILGYSSDD